LGKYIFSHINIILLFLTPL